MKSVPDRIYVTRAVKTEKEAVREKMSLLNRKWLGIVSPVTYELKGKRKIYVPCELFIFSYAIRRSPRNSGWKGFFDREGQVGIIFDQNEAHPFHCDILENIDLIEAEKGLPDGDILPDSCSGEDAEKESRAFAQNQILCRAFRMPGEMRLVKRKRFYRPAWELTVEARGKEMIRYAYADAYRTEREHISGLKCRLEI